MANKNEKANLQVIADKVKALGFMLRHMGDDCDWIDPGAVWGLGEILSGIASEIERTQEK